MDGGGAPAARQAFKARVRQVKGKHSKERRLQGRSERIEAAKRARDHADTPADQTSAQEAIDLLQGLEAETGGADIASVSSITLHTIMNHAQFPHRPLYISMPGLNTGASFINSGTAINTRPR